MRRPLAAIVIALSALALPSVAAAKEITKVSVCGAGGSCTTFDGSNHKNLMFLAEDGGPTDPPARAAAWYRVKFTVDEREHGGGYARWSTAYVPSADSMRVRDEAGFTWVSLNSRAAKALKRAAADLPALPKSRLRGLDVTPPEAQVDEVFNPAAKASTSERTAAVTGDGGTPWGWIVSGLVATSLVLALLARSVRRRRQAASTTAGASAGAQRAVG